MPEPPIDIQRHGEITIAKITSSSLLEMTTLDQLDEGFQDIVLNKGRCRIILDFSAVRMMSSYALGVLLRLHKSVEQAGGRMICAAVPKQLMASFRIAKLDKIFEFVHDTKHALKSFGANTQ